MAYIVDAGYKNSQEYREEYQGSHPVIGVSATSFTYNTEMRKVTVVLTFANLSSFEAETKLHAHLLWGGVRFPGETEIPRQTSFDRVIAIGPNPDKFNVTISYVLPPEQAAQWTEEKGLMAVGAAATYADRDAATEYDFAGSVRLKQSFMDIDTSRWFQRPKSAAIF